MASTFESSKVADGIPTRTLNGLNSVKATYNVATALVVNDVIKMVKVPKGARIVDIILACGVLDTDGTPAVVLAVGDGTTAGRFITGSTVGQAGGVVRLGVAAGLGYVYTADDTIDIKATTAADALAAAADVTLTVIYDMQS